MSDSTPPKTVKAPKAQSPIQQLQALLDQMPEDQRAQLERAGVHVPGGDLAALAEGHYKFGVRCTQCNGIALYFIGEKWRGPEGEDLDLPPTYLHHSKIAWTQDLPVEKINRNRPKCQHCEHPVALSTDGAFRSDRGRIVEIDAYKRGRDEVFDKKYLADFRKRVNNGGGSEIQVSENYTTKDIPVSQTIAAQRGPNALKELEHVAEATGVKQMVATGKIPS